MQDVDNNQLPIMMDVVKVRQYDINMSTYDVKVQDLMSRWQILTPIPSMEAYDDPWQLLSKDHRDAWHQVKSSKHFSILMSS